MFWFDGSVSEAVDRVKSSGVFLLVFVRGEDALTKKYEACLEDTNLGLDVCVAIKIPHDSVAFQQFKEIYVTVPVPSVFLLESNGTPMKIVSSKQLSELTTAISDVLKWQKSKHEVKQKNQTILKPRIQIVGNKRILESPTMSSEIYCNTSSKIFQISEEDVKKRLKEIQGFPRFLLLGPHLTNDSPSYSNTNLKHQSARIQFRLPNDSMPCWEFPNLCTLGDVKEYLMEKMKLSSNFRLLRTYPKSTFTPQDDGKTLEELRLTPSATLIVVPVEDKTVQAKIKSLIVHQSFLSNVFSVLFWPLINLYNYFKKHFFKVQNKNERKAQRLPSDTSVEKIVNKKTSTSNIHSLKLDEDSDTDTEHPDNGNSTQQKFQK